MTFCGQCGFSLSAGDTRCPRCNTVVEVPLDASQANAPTVETSSFTADKSQPVDTQTADPQKKLILRPATDASQLDYSTPSPYDATSRVSAADMGAIAHPGQVQSGHTYGQTGAAYGGYVPAPGHPTTGTAYPGYTAGTSGYQRPAATSYPTSQQAKATQSTRGRSAALVIILIGLLFVLAAMVLLVLQHNGTI